MFRRFHRIALIAGVSVALIAAVGSPASAGASAAGLGGPAAYPQGRALPGHPYAAAPGARAASTPEPVNVAGTITWKIDYFFQGVTGGDKQSGTFSIALTGLNFKNYTPARDTSTYSVTDNTNERWNGAANCKAHLTGNFSGSDSLPWVAKSNSAYGTVSFTFHPSKTYVITSIGVPYTETQKTVWTGPPGSGCDKTTTGTVYDRVLPGCFNKAGGGTGLVGVLHPPFPEGAVNLNCSGTYHEPQFPGTGYSWSVTGSLSVSTHCVPPNQLSGPDWADQFPDSRLVSALADPFQQDVTRFINAMDQAGITVGVNSTLRPLQRAYLMHYSWLIAHDKINPKDVPKFQPPAGQAPVNICWMHTNPSGAEDLAASVAAAQQMVGAYHIASKVAPALTSQHTKGLAIDMNTTWTQPSITIVDGSGQNVPVNTTPHSGMNTDLMAIGLTYHVHHFCYPPGTCATAVPADDPIHWSNNGH